MLAIEGNLWQTRACVPLQLELLSEAEKKLLLKWNLVGEVVDTLKYYSLKLLDEVSC